MARRFSGERGASLMLALGFLALFGLMMPSLLQLGSTNLLGTARLREQRSAVYAADGATDGAIQYLRAHDLCGRPGIGSCPISQFTSTVNGVTATTTWAFSGLPIHYDRTFDLTTTVAGAPRVTAKVIIRDSNVTSVEKPVDVLNWTYKR